MADDKQVIIDYLKAKEKVKSKHYFKDFLELFPDKGPRQVKKVLSDLVKEGVIEYWSSGSTTMYGLTGSGKQGHSADEQSSGHCLFFERSCVSPQLLFFCPLLFQSLYSRRRQASCV